MSKQLSERARRSLNATSASEQPVLRLEIIHPYMVEPARVVEDSQDFPYGVDYLWLPGHLAAAGDIAIPSGYTGRWYRCTVGGITAADEPAWPADGETVADGAAVWEVGGPQFRACAFRYTLPDDQQGQLPQAELSIDNVGRELMEFIEGSNGGVGAECRMMLGLRSTPDVIEWEITVDMKNLKATYAEVSATLGFENMLDLPAVAISHRPDTSPGLF